jgi:carboxylesterase type B
MFYNLVELFDPLDDQLATSMRAYWTSFATDGVPKAAGSPVWQVRCPLFLLNSTGED